MPLTASASCEQHVSGERLMRMLTAVANTSPADSSEVSWSRPSCGIETDAETILLMHVAGERHSPAIDVLRHGGRIDGPSVLFQN